MSPLYYLAIAMFAGLLLTRLAKLLHLPNVTGYLVAGVLIGPFCFNLLNKDAVISLGIITDLALGFIAFSIGNEFKLSEIKKMGRSIFIITALEALTATFIVTVVLLLFKVEPAVAVTLGAIAASTAPAATLLVVRQYKADGPLTHTLLPVVALDDAVGLIAYAIAVSVAKTLALHTSLDLVKTVVNPIVEIILSLLAGFLLGLILAFLNRYFKSHNNRVSLGLAMVLMGVTLANKYNLSSLLLCMMVGGTYINLRNDAPKILAYVDEWTAPLFMLFFVLSGAELNILALSSIGVIGVIYVLMRAGGKALGAFLGGKITKAPSSVCNYLGLTLMPQAGVAIGMARMVIKQLPQFGSQIQTVILSATLVYEFIGPLVAKFALYKAGEIK